MTLLPPRTPMPRKPDITTMEAVLRGRGFGLVAGADEAGRGACAGPLVAAACILPEGRRGKVPELADSKLLTALARDRVYAQVVRRALSWSVIVVPAADVDKLGAHVANVAALRRALAALTPSPDYALTDGFPVDGLGVPGLAVWKGDQVSACVAAASVLAKVTRDRLMSELDETYPAYGFADHKGYCTSAHDAALEEWGPCPEHRRRWVNVARHLRQPGPAYTELVDPETAELDDDDPASGSEEHNSGQNGWKEANG